MKERIGQKIKLTSYEDLMGVGNEESAVDVNINEIHSFENHPFKVQDDERMQELVESIRVNGVLTPVLIRPSKKTRGYEMISGHRRMHAATLAGLTVIPAIVRDMDDDTAVLAMVDANIQREELLPSEKAFSFKMKMEDDITKLYVSKTDITGDVEIPGAKLTILDEDDQVVESWTSTNEPHYVERLKIGKYTLRREQAPKGYILSNDVAFEVADTGEIQKVAMQDDTAKGKVILNKTDAENGEPLKGVEFELRDSNGKVLEKLVTDAAGHAESGLYEIATYKNGEFGDPIKYYLVETKALDGYTLEPDPIEIIFEYVDQNTPIIEVIKDLTNKLTPQQPGTPTTPSSPSPRTGDDTNLWLPIILIAVSGSLIAGLIHGNRKKKKQNIEKSDGMPE